MCSWVSFIVLVLCFSFIGVSNARHQTQPHSAATLVGTVYCDTCFRQPSPKSAHFISGAKVAVECGGDHPKHRFRQVATTNENGEFEANLPVSVSKHVEKIKGCSVRLISSGKPYCAVAAAATSSEIHFKSKKPGARIFSAGFFTFKPELCDQKDFPPSLPDPPAPFLPPVPVLDPLPVPLPDLPVPVPPLVPPLPRLPGVPLPPIFTRQNAKPSEFNKLSDQKTFGTFKPPSLTPLMPPLLPSLPPVSISLFPPVPGLISSPSPPAFRIPGFPSVPPAAGSTDLKKATTP